MRKLYYLACSIVLSGLTACEVPPLADGSSAETAEGVATAPISHTIPAAEWRWNILPGHWLPLTADPFSG